MITTITPYWNRPHILRTWIRAVAGATQPDMKHIVFFVGEPAPDWIIKEYGLNPAFQFVQCLEDKPGRLSIGHYHNLGAKLACTEWMMKMDVDTLPNVKYFRELIKLLRTTQPREWFNGGMVYVCQHSSNHFLTENKMPVLEHTYNEIMANLKTHCGNLNGPSATNFICRVKDYLNFGGCDERFQGYGWEDYYQIYMLERQFRGREPLNGPITMDNVTKRCCMEISRMKARALQQRNPWLCLLHHYHLSSPDTSYKSQQVMLRNKEILLSNLQKFRYAN